MFINKRAQFFALALVVFTVFLCGVVISLYFVQQSNTHASLVSPSVVLELRDNLSILELREIELIKKSFNNISADFGSEEFEKSFRSNFIKGVIGNKNITEFLFGDLFFNGVEIRSQDKNKGFLTNIVYPKNLMYYDSNGFYFSRTKLEKRMLLTAEDNSHINFPVYFVFEFERKYLINEDGEVVKL